MDTTIRFLLNGALVEISDLPPETTLLNWLRYERGLTGTKEGCAEGDCGACTVGLREIGPGGTVDTRPVNACIQLLPMVHGREVVTVEHLRGPEGQLHPVQAAFVKHDALQCGFCTPGMIMSCAAMVDQGKATDRESIQRHLAGNLCRCGTYPHIFSAVEEAAK